MSSSSVKWSESEPLVGGGVTGDGDGGGPRRGTARQPHDWPHLTAPLATHHGLSQRGWSRGWSRGWPRGWSLLLSHFSREWAQRSHHAPAIRAASASGSGGACRAPARAPASRATPPLNLPGRRRRDRLAGWHGGSANEASETLGFGESVGEVRGGRESLRLLRSGSHCASLVALFGCTHGSARGEWVRRRGVGLRCHT